jgi:hypothetical protein
MSSAGGCPSWQAMASVRTSIVPPWPCPPLTDTPGPSPAVTTSQVTALIHDFAVSLGTTPSDTPAIVPATAAHPHAKPRHRSENVTPASENPSLTKAPTEGRECLPGAMSRSGLAAGSTPRESHPAAAWPVSGSTVKCILDQVNVGHLIPFLLALESQN